jgi:hypothetical protein
VVITLPSDTQYSTHQVDWPGLLMLGDKQIFHFVSLAKKTVVDSTGRRNTEYSEIYTGGFCDGSTWQAWFKRYTERGTLATMA